MNLNTVGALAGRAGEGHCNGATVGITGCQPRRVAETPATGVLAIAAACGYRPK